MPPFVRLTPQAWAQLRYEYEHTKRPVDDLCLAYGISAGTLRDRVRRWGWTPRWGAIPLHGPPAVVVPMIAAVPQARFPSPHSPSKTGVNALMRGEGGEQRSCEPGEGVPTAESPRPPHPNPLPRGQRESAVHVERAITHNEPSPHLHDTRPIGQRVQGAIAQVMPALETTLASLAAGPMAPRQMEQAARALGSLTRTLRELNGLVAGHRVEEPPEEDIEALRASVLRTLETIIAEQDDDVPRQYLAGWEEFAAQADPAYDDLDQPPSAAPAGATKNRGNRQ